MEVKCSGTLGDAFIILIKIIDKKINKIYHYSRHEKIFPLIKEIYSLLNDVEVITKKIPTHHPLRKGLLKGSIKKK